MNGNFVTGAGYFLRGLAITFQPGLRRFVVIPLVANVVLFSLIVLSALHSMPGWRLAGWNICRWEARQA